MRTVSVFFAPEMVDDRGARARILAAAPVIREMILYGSRWPITRSATDPRADAFFVALANVVFDWLDHEIPLSLPTSSDPVIASVMSYTNSHLERLTVGEVGRAVGLSERTLRRRFALATGMTWRQYLLQCRVLRAMTQLAEPGPSVIDVATSVGFESVSAFARAFRGYVGETPSAYRKRVTTGVVPLGSR